ncbi:hypothetical protein ABZ863_21715 [Saccharomonospora sp. NPDC046836]|uniref:hypothetical protein n=1 Tax=Saccharomonospora sp. NPDC046836 TaxID=3156921 RepID=UPI0033D51830
MDFESVADELYGLDRDEFVAVRGQRAAEARDASNRELAARIRELRKPTSAAWLVNGLARRARRQIGELAELGEALRNAHAELAGERLRALSRQRHELIQALTDEAVRLAGGPVGESVVHEVYDTLDAALADPAAGALVAAGRLTTALQPADAFAGDWFAVGPAPPQPKQAHKPAPEPPRDDAARRLREQRKRVRATLAEAQTARNAAVRELRAAEHDEARARERTAAARTEFETADERVAQLETELSELE